MKRTLNELREYALSLVDDIEFTWKGARGLIVPYNREKYILCFEPDDPGTEFHNVDEMLNAPYMNGRSIAEVCGEIDFWS